MKRAVAILIFSAIAIISASEEEKEEEMTSQEGFSNRIEEMMYCLNKENVTESEMKNFVFAKEPHEVNKSLKMGILCFAKKINFFDGTSWNMTVIEESEAKNPKMLKTIKECLQNDDSTKEPHERAYIIQKCIIDKGNSD